MSWKDKLGIFGDRIATEHSVDGTTQNFYVLRTSTALKLKSLGKPIGRLLAVIFEKKDKDASVKQTTDGEGFNVTDIEAADVAVLKYRGQRMDSAVNDLVSLATDPKNMDLIATIIMCSMRDVFDPKNQPDPKDFYEEVDVGQLKDMLIGTIKANAKVFGPFQKAMTSLSAQAIARVQEAVGEENPADESQASEENQESSPSLDNETQEA